MEDAARNLAYCLTEDKTKYFWETAELETFLTARGFDFSKKNLATLLTVLAENDIFRWLSFVGAKLPEAASESDEFLNLLLLVIKKVKGDLAQGPLIRGMINIGTTNPKLANMLFDSIVSTKEENMVLYSGLVLGGVGKKEPDNVLDRITENIKTESPYLRAAYIKALRVMFEDSQLVQGERVFEILRSAASPRENGLVRSEAANAFIDFYKFNPSFCYNQILDLAKQGDSKIRLVIAQRLWFGSLKPKPNIMSILKECAQDDSPETLSAVSWALSNQGKEYPRETLNIVRQWIRRRKYFEIREIDFLLSEIGKANTAKCIEIIMSWIKNTKDTILMAAIPSLLVSVSSSNREILLDYLKAFLTSPNKIFPILASRTIGDIIVDLHATPSMETVRKCFGLAKILAKMDEMQEEVSMLFHNTFSAKPRFATSDDLVEITQDWVSDENWKIRRAITWALGPIAEDKLDVRETLEVRLNTATGKTEIFNIKVEEITKPEGEKAYDFLVALTKDSNSIVAKESRTILEEVDKRLTQKKQSLDQRTKP